MQNLKAISKIVKYILEIDPATRSNDSLLYYRVCEFMNKDVLSMPFGMVLLSMKSLKMPNTESVRRSRQKVQATFPDLAATEEVEAMRDEQEKAYKAFAVGELNGL